MTGAAMNTVLRLLADLGSASAQYQYDMLRNLPCKRIECDEVWQFCYAKEKNVPPDKQGQFGYGDVWTWVALCSDTNLVPSWLVGPRDAHTALVFMDDLAHRLRNRVQLTAQIDKVPVGARRGSRFMAFLWPLRLCQIPGVI